MGTRASVGGNSRRGGPVVNRAYSTLTLKRAPGDGREIIGIASTPRMDKAGDILEPLGAVFSLPMPLLWMHDHSAPIGKVTHAKATAAGIEFRAEIAKVETPGKLKDRVDEALDSINADLVRGTSVGFQPIEYKGLPSGGKRFTRWSWHELSVVTLACNADASIQAIKAADDLALLKHREPVRVVKLERPVATAMLTEAERKAVRVEGLDRTTDMLIRSIAAGAKATDECLAEHDQRIARLEQLAAQQKDPLDMTVDEFCAHVRAQRKRLTA